jgi:hypothetical protein
MAFEDLERRGSSGLGSLHACQGMILPNHLGAQVGLCARTHFAYN